MQKSKVYGYWTEGFARLVKYLRVIFLAKFGLAGILAIVSPFLGDMDSYSRGYDSVPRWRSIFFRLRYKA